MRWRGRPQQARSPAQRERTRPSLQLLIHLQKLRHLPLIAGALQLPMKWHRLQQWSLPVAWSQSQQKLIENI